jgi:hypothetical protein
LDQSAWVSLGASPIAPKLRLEWFCEKKSAPLGALSWVVE